MGLVRAMSLPLRSHMESPKYNKKSIEKKLISVMSINSWTHQEKRGGLHAKDCVRKCSTGGKTAWTPKTMMGRLSTKGHGETSCNTRDDGGPRRMAQSCW
uniref:Uncharacterized protein n=1 Tax=Cuerna arida TaxID=1464854 RepID=A0A1B6EZF1_9HEMI